eukprot:CAMPEP_0168770846 /NCGR_PEP_ID=MMETSP0725-20121227/3136_1 /TAXON_ID=265536 /ORGANISM="Amphiprora sp., Strain CCMP467" /LENGTH=807 /DNA_ID=CAMNT_0008820315 /DNA_START=203 /DNA_END=2627 /DNA_ORIENTATION=+
MKSILAVLFCARVSLCDGQVSDGGDFLYPLWDSNRQFYPEDGSDANTRKCTIPPFQEEDSSFVPTDDSCPVKVGSAVFVDFQELAVRYAPYLFYHPLEENTMSAVNRTLDDTEKGRLVIEWDDYGTELFSNELSPESLLETTRNPDYSMFSHKFHFEHDLDEEYQAGDGFDEEGRSRAPIYWRAFASSHGTITFNYYFYYTWSGPAGVGVLTSMNGTTQYTRLQQPPYGVQEGDWESISVNDLSAPRPTLSAGGHLSAERLGPNSGLVFADKDTTHPVGFVALGTHEIYPSSVEEVVYADVQPLEFFANLQQVMLVHRTAYADADGQYRYFEPNFNNVKQLPEQYAIPEQVDRSDYWVAYSGVWGRITDLHPNITGTYPICLADDTLSYKECPTEEENEVFYLYLQMSGVIEASRPLVAAATLIHEYLQSFFNKGEFWIPFGPATSRYYNEHVFFDEQAPIYNQTNQNETGEAFCQRIIDEIPDTTRIAIDFEYLPFIQNVVGVVLLFVFLTILNIALLSCWNRRAVKPTFETDSDGRFLRPTKYLRNELFVPFWYLCGAFVLTVLAGVGFFGGYLRITNFSKEREAMVNWSAFDQFLIITGSFTVVADSLMVFVCWTMVENVWLKVKRHYQMMVGEESSAHWLDRFSHKGRRTFVFTYSWLMASLMLALFMVVSLYIGSLDGICFSFPGWEDIQCGKDFQDFCKDWENISMLLTMWSAFVVVAGHFYMVFIAGGFELVLEWYEKTLSHYPSSRDDYLNYLEKLGISALDENTEAIEKSPLKDVDTAQKDGNEEIVDVDEPQSREVS